MGSGFKNFTTGDVLSASEVDNYLMRQTVMTFASSTARDTALSSYLDEGMVAYLEDTNTITVYDGTTWKNLARYTDIGVTQSWSPTFLTGITIGNATVSGTYQVVNDLAFVRGSLEIGSTTVMTGNLSVDLPVDSATPAELQTGGQVDYLDISNQWHFAGRIDAYGLTDRHGFSYFYSTGTAAPTQLVANTANTPFAFATGDIISWSVTYRTA